MIFQPASVMTQIPEDMDLSRAHFPKSSIAANGYFFASWTIAYTFGWNHAFPLLLGPSSCGRRVSRSSSWIHKPQTWIISLWSRKPERDEEIMNWIMSIHTCNIASAIPASTTVPSAPSATFAVSARYSVHTKTQNMWAKEVANHLHSVAHLCIWHFKLLAVFCIENLIMDHPQPEDKHEYLERPAALGAAACTYNTPTGVWRKKCIYQGQLAVQ